MIQRYIEHIVSKPLYALKNRITTHKRFRSHIFAYLMLRILLLYILLLNATIGMTQNYEYNDNCKKAYQAIFKLKIQEGRKWLDLEKNSNPHNLLPYFIGNYADFLSIYISENKTLFDTYKVNKDIRLDKLSSGDKNSPYYLYTQAGIYLQWAFTRIKFGEYITAVFEVKKAYTLLKENQQKFPNFKPNRKDLAFLKTLFGAIPDKYSAGAKILGLKGNIDEGMKELGVLLQDPSFEFKEDTWILYTMLLLHVKNDKNASWQLIENTKIPLGDNLLNHFIVSSVALYTGNNDKIINTLSLRPKSSSYYPFPYLEYMLGIAKLNRLDADADIPLKNFVSAYKGKNYFKEAYRKLAWHYYLQGNTAMYNTYMKEVIIKGEENIDEDKAAAIEARSKIMPNKVLLQCRLLCDGNYTERAYNTLTALQVQLLTSSKDKVEYYYRWGRVYHLQNNIEKALKYYALTIDLGASLPYYFAANACIKTAQIYEKQQKCSQAISYFKKATTYKGHEYMSSVAAEAKAGINRCEN